MLDATTTLFDLYKTHKAITHEKAITLFLDIINCEPNKVLSLDYANEILSLLAADTKNRLVRLIQGHSILFNNLFKILKDNKENATSLEITVFKLLRQADKTRLATQIKQFQPGKFNIATPELDTPPVPLDHKKSNALHKTMSERYYSAIIKYTRLQQKENKALYADIIALNYHSLIHLVLHNDSGAGLTHLNHLINGNYPLAKKAMITYLNSCISSLIFIMK